MAEGKTVVVPLTGTNYCTWKIQCKMSLISKGLWGIVSKAEAEPASAERHALFVGTVLWQPLFYLSIHLSYISLEIRLIQPTKLSTQFQRKY